MALVKCKECGKKVSNKAEVCVECGYPLNKKKSSEEVVTLQKTKKSLKLQLLLSKFMIIVGYLIVALLVSMHYFSIHSKEALINGVLAGVLGAIPGAIFYGVTKVNVWWNHS